MSLNLPMVSQSLTLNFSLLTGYYSRRSFLVLGSVKSFCLKWSLSELSGFYVFLEDDSTDLREIFFKV